MVETAEVSIVSSLEVLPHEAPVLAPLPVQGLTAAGNVGGQVPGQHLPDYRPVLGGAAKPGPLS